MDMDRMAYTSHSKDAFPLQLPQQTQDKLSFASRHPKAIKGWLKILPAANTGAVSKQVFLALKEINRTRIPLEVREQIIALILPQVEYIMATLQKHFLVQAVVLDDKRSKVAQLTKALLLELTHAYRIILSDTSELSNKKQRAIRGNAYHQAIYYFSRLALLNYQLYCPQPKGLWYNVHQLYAHARDEQLTKHTYTSVDEASSSIRQQYLRLLMLGCAQTRQLKQNDIELIFLNLSALAEAATLYTPPTDNELWVINPDYDAPPLYQALLKPKERHRPNLLGLSMTSLTAELKPRIDKLIPGKQASLIAHHLRRSWGQLNRRLSQRRSCQGKLQLVLGLAASHHYLSGERPFDPVAEYHAQQERDETTIPLTPLSLNQLDMHPTEVQFFGQDKTSQRNADTPTSLPPVTPQSRAPSQYFTQYQGKMLDSSATGYCVELQVDTPLQTQAGELAIFHLPDQHGWHVAILRWIESTHSGNLQLGLERLAAYAEAAATRQPASNQQAATPWLRALVLPGNAEQQEDASIITSALPYGSGQVIQLLHNGHIQRITLKECIKRESCFCQYSYNNHEKSTPHGQPASYDEFDAVWSIL